MSKDLFFALWFFLPAGAANMVPVLVAKISWLKQYNAPIDFGRKFRGQRLLGPHKTLRGLISGILAATFVVFLQQLLAQHYGAINHWTSGVDYKTLNVLIVGPLLGFGALAGDAIESFFKRQRKMPAGKGWFPFDQTDYIIGGALAVAPFIHLTLRQYVILIILWLIVHIVVNYIGYLLKIKDGSRLV
ncbi:MAG: CDP-archaeol synthase [Candidatus Saccharimonadales bacterium]